ncbi:NAD(P)-dependent oxidoreductase [Leptospira fluminis]|uniref:NAD(P)-dependent oxidoreductase n=1 Tax=Leptospira fluminis TaxID=2484979 RepID=A0A4V3JEB6_9LEPT|nr:NAD(P)-dependent oxidoreductase [Leptospira fluminis]TGK17265.1 NAD(P)-dependent oxidoreductase [Leptospira fluminis]
MKILVIGGSGFLGSHVADQLSEAGHSVAIFDRVLSPWLRADQKMILGDLLNQSEIEGAIRDCDVVYNFAALADLNQAIDKPIDTVQVNILGNVYVLEACRKYSVRRFFYASTIYVFSREGGFYRCSKQASESYVEEYQRKYGLQYTILRFGSLYGPRSDESNGLYRIVKKALETGKIQYQGSPDTLREYIHVEDAAKASVTAMGEEFCNQSVVLTGQEPMRVLDLLKMIAEMLGHPDSVEFSEGEQIGHYVRTPYAYQPKLGRKFIPPMHVDLGQGLLQLIEEVEGKR